MPINILNLPDDILIQIMQSLDVKTILLLRRICRKLLNFVDEVKPEIRLKSISISIHPDKISVIYRPDQGMYAIEYLNRTYQRVVTRGKGLIFINYDYSNDGKILNNENYVETFLRDFEMILKLQKTVLKNFELKWMSHEEEEKEKCQNLIEKLKKILEPYQKVLACDVMKLNVC
ncbi:hypothetical protein GCK72_019642 [Caenorhabditis remanei]|uniref:F-box domain-containing protein n=1 Tax=Caenorhabditis remanei TaxID=31234 RepID=A0A6A5GEF2_CAERE|nr:hypothetical protein GCK72_019642 [Caenorhabditis remanei]KAF1753086.1 hypothetical protein GCK72_019642 [Caenorhabditis remanei]